MYIALGDFLGHGEQLRAAVVHLLVARFLGVEMILPRLARDQLPAARYFYSFGECFVGFHDTNGYECERMMRMGQLSIRES